MNAKFTKSLFRSSLLVVAIATTLTGCGGSGASTNGIATRLAASYTVEIVPAPAGAVGISFKRMSPNGTIAGEYNDGTRNISFVYKDGVRTDVTPGTEDCGIGSGSVTDSGTIEGQFNKNGADHPYSTAGSGYHDLSAPGNFVGGSSVGRDVNGVAYVAMFDASFVRSSFRESNGVFTPITIPGATNVGLWAASQSGHVIAFSQTGNTREEYLFAPGQTTGTKILAGYAGISVNAINNLGAYGGSRTENAFTFPFIVFRNGQYEQMSAFGGYYASLQAINDGNIAVGAYSPVGGGYNAFAWSNEDGQVPLNPRIMPTAGFNADVAYGVDNKGRICGQGTYNGDEVGFILTPVNP
ncbi:MAG: hypothetical protein WCG75_08930 [Armatimonadota bacterium]